MNVKVFKVIIKWPLMYVNIRGHVHCKYLYRCQQSSSQNILISKAKCQPVNNVDVYILCFLQHPTVPPNHKISCTSKIQVTGYH